MTVSFGSIFRLALIGLFGIAASGCKKEPEPAPRPPSAAGTGAIRGTVNFDGSPAPPRLIEAHCHAGAKPIYDDSLVVDPGGGLRNVVVYVENGPNVALPPV